MKKLLRVAGKYFKCTRRDNQKRWLIQLIKIHTNGMSSYLDLINFRD